jgi:hypothetical protein
MNYGKVPNIFRLVHSLSTANACDAVSKTWNCALFRFPVVWSIYAMLFGIFAIAIERTVATVKYRTYEVHGSVAVGVTLIVLQVTIP